MPVSIRSGGWSLILASSEVCRRPSRLGRRMAPSSTAVRPRSWRGKGHAPWSEIAPLAGRRHRLRASQRRQRVSATGPLRCRRRWRRRSLVAVPCQRGAGFLQSDSQRAVTYGHENSLETESAAHGVARRGVGGGTRGRRSNGGDIDGTTLITNTTVSADVRQGRDGARCVSNCAVARWTERSTRRRNRRPSRWRRLESAGSTRTGRR